jgi:iron uptake system EfeUOB component EfeO/EfeM
MITTIHPRPLTSTLSDAQLALVAFYPPAAAEDHLVQGWIAIGKAVRGEDERANLVYARNRLECARSEPVARSVKPRDRKAYEAEVASLARAIDDYVP